MKPSVQAQKAASAHRRAFAPVVAVLLVGRLVVEMMAMKIIMMIMHPETMTNPVVFQVIHTDFASSTA